MVRLTSIITKTGDDGKTGLADGSRRAKSDERVEAYGSVDEANSALGLARSLLEQAPHAKRLIPIVARVQNDLFNLGADLSSPDLEKSALRIDDDDIALLEEDASVLNEDLPPLDSFILPAGTAEIAALHLARTITRRAERQIVRLSEKEKINLATLRYMNRLSDLLFIMARVVANGKETKWVPKK